MKTLKKILVMVLVTHFGIATILCCCFVQKAEASINLPACHKQTQSKAPVKSDQPCCSKMLKAVSDSEFTLKNVHSDLLNNFSQLTLITSSFTLTSLKHHEYRYAQISPQAPPLSALSKSCILRL